MKNTKIALSIFAVAVIVVAGYFILHPVNAPGQNLVASTTPQVASSTKTAANGPKIVVTYALFDSESFLSTSTYPVVTGIANVPKVGVIIRNSVGNGILGSWEIPVIAGHWSYGSSVALVPGWYTVTLFIDKTVMTTARLTVNKP